jgi:VIT1/CCC1 family predicted Fe2+/Mn2+ transporter
MNKLYLSFAWVICAIGIYFEANEIIWRAIRSVGLGGHAIGAIFIIIPFAVLALEWLVVVGVPVLFIIDYIKGRKPDDNL